jgi:hypothetical protein
LIENYFRRSDAFWVQNRSDFQKHSSMQAATAGEDLNAALATCGRISYHKAVIARWAQCVTGDQPSIFERASQVGICHQRRSRLVPMWQAIQPSQR